MNCLRCGTKLPSSRPVAIYPLSLDEACLAKLQPDDKLKLLVHTKFTVASMTVCPMCGEINFNEQPAGVPPRRIRSMTDQQFDCHMQMLSAIFEELKAIRGLLEKKGQPPGNYSYDPNLSS